ncbi:hypothetical protein RJT34_05850 [Clitoria ternatea]|uniref:Glycosyltransferase n=1 Tax=Clitoria ternatea TaxID=43366 RepID=A0AAN9PT85_CLITE
MVSTKPHAILLPSPGMGHLIPMLELGNRLLTHHSFHVTVFVVTTTTSGILKLTSKYDNLNIILVPSHDVSTELEPNRSVEDRIVSTMLHSLPFLRSQMLSMNPSPSLLIVDIFGVLAFPLARDLGMLTSVFFTTNAWLSALTIYLPFMDKEMQRRHTNNHEPLFIPGCQPVRFKDTLEVFLSPVEEDLLKAAKEIVAADGILINTWQDLEPAATKAVREHGILGRFTKGSVYPVGPIVRTVELKPDQDHVDRHAVLNWLDRQPGESVIYVSFGSGGTMSEGQMRELAFGLELSQQRFVWVVRAPKEGDACGSFFDVTNNGGEETVGYLPEGFLRRTEGVGVVVPAWAPQIEILGHPATGGFVTHCGWNSVLESVMNGVPMVAWPLYAEQKMNGFMLSAEVGVAVRVEEEGGVVCRERVAAAVRRVMVDEEGLAMRNKAKELKVSGENALSKFGSSYKSLCEIRKDCELRLLGCEGRSVSGAYDIGDTDGIDRLFCS